MNNILEGNVLDRLKDIDEKSIQCVVTSPPYWGLRDYGENEQLGLEETPEEYVENMVKVFHEVKKVLRDDGTLWLNLGDSYIGGGRGWQYCKEDSLQNAHIKAGVKYGKPTGKIKGLKSKDLVGIPWRVAFALQSDGWYLRQDIIWHKPNPMPESVTDRCTKSHEYIFLLSKSSKYYYDKDAIAEPCNYPNEGKWGGDNKGYDGDKTMKARNLLSYKNGETRNKRSVWPISLQPYKEAHFAVFPEKLPEICIKAGSKKGDIVLDPFFGSGTTGYVAQRLDRAWLGIELNKEYIKIAEKRFNQQELF
jgi:DNA modification methylase